MKRKQITKDLMLVFLMLVVLIVSLFRPMNVEASSKVKVWVIDTITNESTTWRDAVESGEYIPASGEVIWDINNFHVYSYNTKGLVTNIHNEDDSKHRGYIISDTTMKYNNNNELTKLHYSYNDETYTTSLKYDMSDGVHNVPYIHTNKYDAGKEYLKKTYTVKDGKVIKFQQSYKTISYEYNKHGDIVKITDTAALKHPVFYKNVYDDDGKLVKRKMKWVKGTTAWYSDDYARDLVVVQTIKYKEIEVDKNMADTVKAYQWAILNMNLNCAFNKIEGVDDDTDKINSWLNESLW